MGVEKKKLWCPVSNTDLTEGRGAPKVLAYCTHKATAERLSRGKGVQGTDCRVEQQTVWVDSKDRVFRKIGEVKHPTDEDLARNERKEAIEKAKTLGLTDEEIKLIQENGNPQ